MTTSFDTGLNVPTYTVKQMKSDCFVLDVLYENREDGEARPLLLECWPRPWR
jgi:hypothetical protein